MSALRRTLLGGVVLMTALGSSSAGAAVAETGNSSDTALASSDNTGEPVSTPWAQSVRNALAARKRALMSSVDSMKHRLHQEGLASWYGEHFNRHRTSSGTMFDKTALTAAHPTLPLGSKILVTSKETGRSVVVMVNDRGPYVHNRIIDLSKAAAERLGMLKKGVAHVEVQPVPEATEVAQAPIVDDAENRASSVQNPEAQPTVKYSKPFLRKRHTTASH
ncbi:septal ring lytic transglycosylase RlpA family protein [Acetobacter thailandicus]|uniref:septal ring lytic transglycosylase RlpA family protein n=1 Tax=Acetobacter thailandicus TaxID=1502842 RepID=UPI001BA8D818|nr:septal ring lytic transglycosylase RlpA family protein [Acetobacter thailandicus]MBS0985893.1 septal ring lytic transglycosylase RlpA family protein [Acetobacter thailandicus]